MRKKIQLAFWSISVPLLVMGGRLPRLQAVDDLPIPTLRGRFVVPPAVAEHDDIRGFRGRREDLIPCAPAFRPQVSALVVGDTQPGACEAGGLRSRGLTTSADREGRQRRQETPDGEAPRPA